MSDELNTVSRWRTLRVIAGVLGFSLITHHSPLITAQEIPLVGQPSSDFYGAAGNGVKVAWSGVPNTIAEDSEFVATLTISNVTNPKKITRPDLKKLRNFNDNFAITDNSDPPPGDRDTEVKFSYRCRPRSRQTTEFPTLIFYYFNPAAPAGKQFKQVNTGRAIPIVVTAAPPKKPPPAVPLAEPEQLFEIATGPSVLEGGAGSVPSWIGAAFLLAGPLVALGWYVAWRWLYPDAERLAKIRRSRAARRALDAIHRANRATDPPAAIAVAVLNYLRTRFPLPPGAVMPSELAAALAELEMPSANCEAVAAFFRKCDAARFAPASDTAVSLAADAGALIAQMEAA